MHCVRHGIADRHTQGNSSLVPLDAPNFQSSSISVGLFSLSILVFRQMLLWAVFPSNVGFGATCEMCNICIMLKSVEFIVKCYQIGLT